MGRHPKCLARVMTGLSDRNIRFEDLRHLVLHFGFEERVRGSHHIFSKDGIDEILNLQMAVSGLAKPYQVKQVRHVIRRYRLHVEEESLES